MFTASKHKVRARSLSFGCNWTPPWMVQLTPACASEVVTSEPSHSIKDPLGGKEQNPSASHFLWKYLTGKSLCAGYIRFSYCKHRDGLLGREVKASYVEQTQRFNKRLLGQLCRNNHSGDLLLQIKSVLYQIDSQLEKQLYRNRATVLDIEHNSA